MADAVKQPAPPKAEPVAATLRPARVLRAVPLLLTGSALVAAGTLAWGMWNAYMGTPWTRDGTVRAYVITVTPEVSGRIIDLPVVANQYVHKGDLLMAIDPTNYQIAVDTAEAVVAQAKADLDNKQAEATRRLKLTTLAVTAEEQQTYVSQEQMAEGVYKQDLASLAQARVNLSRTQIVSPVNGYITNLSAQAGNYAAAGQYAIAVVDADSFWVDGYFEETQLENISIGDPADILLMGRKEPMAGRVSGITSGISVANAQSDTSGLASVNSIFTWIRLAQRIPVRIELDHPSPDAKLVIGLTATVQINPRDGKPNRLFGDFSFW